MSMTQMIAGFPPPEQSKRSAWVRKKKLTGAVFAN